MCELSIDGDDRVHRGQSRVRRLRDGDDGVEAVPVRARWARKRLSPDLASRQTRTHLGATWHSHTDCSQPDRQAGQGAGPGGLPRPGPVSRRGRGGHPHVVRLPDRRRHVRDLRHLRGRGRAAGAPERPDPAGTRSGRTRPAGGRSRHQAGRRAGDQTGVTRKAPEHDIDESRLDVERPKRSAAGVPAVAVSMKRGIEAMGLTPYRAEPAQAQPGRRLRLPGLRLAGPRPGPPPHRGVLRERRQGRGRGGHPRRVGSGVLRRAQPRGPGRAHRVLAGPAGPDHPARGTPPGGTHYEPIRWDEAFSLVAEHLHGLDSPDEAIFYTSGKTSNEAAFLYQLFARAFGTNNLPDCSNMCHESTSVALAETIGIGKGSVTLRTSTTPS